jgi:hypothetical protein
MKTLISFMMLTAIIAVTSCSEDKSGPTGPVAGNGFLKIYMIDAPATIDSVIICVSRVEVHQSGTDTTSGNWFIINDSTRYFDLLLLTNGASAVLGDTTLPAGHYTQIRLIICEGSYVIDNGVRHDLTIPSGMQTGIKLNHPFVIEDGKLYELFLDFNVDKSIIVTGNGEYKLKPTIRIAPAIISGSISGQVLPLDAFPTIWTLVGQDTSTTYTDNDGFFKLMALPEGIYDVNIIPADTMIYNDTTITGVNVLANQTTDLGTITLSTR